MLFRAEPTLGDGKADLAFSLDVDADGVLTDGDRDIRAAVGEADGKGEVSAKRLSFFVVGKRNLGGGDARKFSDTPAGKKLRPERTVPVGRTAEAADGGLPFLRREAEIRRDVAFQPASAVRDVSTHAIPPRSFHFI